MYYKIKKMLIDMPKFNLTTAPHRKFRLSYTSQYKKSTSPAHNFPSQRCPAAPYSTPKSTRISTISKYTHHSKRFLINHFPYICVPLLTVPTPRGPHVSIDSPTAITFATPQTTLYLYHINWFHNNHGLFANCPQNSHSLYQLISQLLRSLAIRLTPKQLLIVI